MDVVLNDDADAVERAAKALLAAGFKPSAKHPFQLLTSVEVGNREFLFNIDLMHPKEAERTPEFYADIIDFGVKDNYDPKGTARLKSVCFKSSGIVFDQNLIQYVPLKGPGIDGAPLNVDIPLLDPTALVLSKCESVASEKRTRDAFDIYYMLTGPRGSATAQALRNLASRFPQVSAHMANLKTELDRPDCRFSFNVRKHAGKAANGLSQNPAAQVLAALF